MAKKPKVKTINIDGNWIYKTPEEAIAGSGYKLIGTYTAYNPALQRNISRAVYTDSRGKIWLFVSAVQPGSRIESITLKEFTADTTKIIS